MSVNLANLTATQQADIQQAIQTGSTANLTADELSIFNSISSNPTANADSTMGLAVEKSKPQTDVSTTTITNNDGSTSERTTTTTKSSAAFAQSEATVADQAVKIADNCAYQTKAGDEMGSGPFGEKALYAQKLKCVAQYGKAPEVTQEVDTKKFDDSSDPTARDNKNACGIGFTSEGKALEYLKKSSNPEIAKLANASGDPTLSTAEKLKATRALDVQLSAMQPDMIDNAKQGQAMIDDKMGSVNPKTGKNYTYQEASAAVREQHPEILDKFGGPVKTTTSWVIPDEWKTEADKTPPATVKGETKGANVIPDPATGTGDSTVKQGETSGDKKYSTTYVSVNGGQKLQVSMNLDSDTEKALEDMGVCSSFHQGSGITGVPGSYTDDGQVYVKQLDYNKLSDQIKSGKIPYDSATGVATLPGGHKVNVKELFDDLKSAWHNEQKYSVNVTD